MKILIIILAVCIFALNISRASPQSRYDPQKIGEKATIKLVHDLDFVNKNFTYEAEEVDQIFNYKNGKYLKSKIKRYESFYRKGRTYHKRLDKEGPAEQVKNEIKLDEAFFQRFQFEYAKSSPEGNREFIILKFKPKPGVDTNKKYNLNRFDKIANNMTGEIHVWTDDLTIKYFNATLSSGQPIKYLGGMFQVEKAIVTLDVNYINGRAMLQTLRAEYKYWSLFSPNQHVIKTIEFKNYRKCEDCKS